MGTPRVIDDYVTGVVFLMIFLVLLIGPIYFFSEFSFFVDKNPVFESEINVAFVVNKTLSIKNLVDRMVPGDSPIDQ